MRQAHSTEVGPSDALKNPNTDEHINIPTGVVHMARVMVEIPVMHVCTNSIFLLYLLTRAPNRSITDQL